MSNSSTRRGAMAAPLALAFAPGLARAAASPLRQPLAVVRVEGRRRALFEVAHGPVTVRDGDVVLGRYEDLSRLGSASWTPLTSERRNELPGSNVVVRFPD